MKKLKRLCWAANPANDPCPKIRRDAETSWSSEVESHQSNKSSAIKFRRRWPIRGNLRQFNPRHVSHTSVAFHIQLRMRLEGPNCMQNTFSLLHSAAHSFYFSACEIYLKVVCMQIHSIAAPFLLFHWISQEIFLDRLSFFRAAAPSCIICLCVVHSSSRYFFCGQQFS